MQPPFCCLVFGFAFGGMPTALHETPDCCHCGFDTGNDRQNRFESTDQRQSVAASRITSYNVCYTKLLRLVQFLDQFAGQAVEFAVCDLGVVHRDSPGDEELGEGEDIAEVDATENLDREQAGESYNFV